MEIPEIKDLNTLLNGVTNGLQCISVEKSRLNAAGDNFGGIILAIKVRLRGDKGHGSIKTVKLVAKLPPSHNEFIHLYQNPSYTYRHELFFYNTILPCFNSFLEELNPNKSIDFFPKFYGGRISLEKTDLADNDAIILLEDLKGQGFTLFDRTVGFNLTSSKLILSKLAKFHAVSIAMKATRPELFDQQIAPNLDEFRIYQIDKDHILATSDKVLETALEMMQDDELCALHFQDIQNTLNTCISNASNPRNSPKFARDTFAAVIHGDLWINNVLVKTRMNKIVDLKFLDLQIYEHASVTRDVLFFIFTSVEESVMKNNFDDLISFYYTNLIAELKDLNCDTSKFGNDVFKHEMEVVANEVVFLQLMPVLNCIYATEIDYCEVEHLDKKVLLSQIYPTEARKARCSLIAREFIRQGWFK